MSPYACSAKIGLAPSSYLFQFLALQMSTDGSFNARFVQYKRGTGYEYPHLCGVWKSFLLTLQITAVPPHRCMGLREPYILTATSE